MFRIILASVCTVIHLYVFWRISRASVFRNTPLKYIVAAGTLFWAGLLLALFLGHGGTGLLNSIIEFLGMNWMAVLSLIFVSLLAADLVTGFGFLLPKTAPLLRSSALVLGLLLSLIALVQGLRPPVIQTYDIRLPGLPGKLDGTVLVAMSDMHLGSLAGERWLKKRLAQVREQRPDMVLLLGDIFEGHGDPDDKLLEVFSRISAPLGVWAVPGNHEFHGGHGRRIDLFRKAGISVLRNRWVQVRPGLILAGVDDLTYAHRRGLEQDYVSMALANRPSGSAILLSHTPWQADKAASLGVNLMLSGHTHGGQIWPFSYLISLSYPMLGGLYKVEGMSLLVCRGTGTWGPRMRLWRPGEIMRVTLRRE